MMCLNFLCFLLCFAFISSQDSGNTPFDEKKIFGGYDTQIMESPFLARDSESTVLQSAVFSVLKTSTCSTAFKTPQLLQRIICAASTKAATCSQDDGGPAIFAKKLAGIISDGLRCEPSVPITLTKVASFIPWIKNVTGIKGY